MRRTAHERLIGAPVRAENRDDLRTEIRCQCGRRLGYIPHRYIDTYLETMTSGHPLALPEVFGTPSAYGHSHDRARGEHQFVCHPTKCTLTPPGKSSVHRPITYSELIELVITAQKSHSPVVLR